MRFAAKRDHSVTEGNVKSDFRAVDHIGLRRSADARAGNLSGPSVDAHAQIDARMKDGGVPIDLAG